MIYVEQKPDYQGGKPAVVDHKSHIVRAGIAQVKKFQSQHKTAPPDFFDRVRVARCQFL